jgi:hypothetical protein
MSVADGTDTGRALQDGVGFDSLGIGRDPAIEIPIHARDLALEPAHVCRNADRLGATRRLESILFHHDHREELTATRHQLCHLLLVLGLQRAKRRADHGGVSSEHFGVDRVGLRSDAERLCEVADLACVDDAHGKSRIVEGARHGTFVAAGCFEHDAVRRSPRASSQRAMPDAVLSSEPRCCEPRVAKSRRCFETSIPIAMQSASMVGSSMQRDSGLRVRARGPGDCSSYAATGSVAAHSCYRPH